MSGSVTMAAQFGTPSVCLPTRAHPCSPVPIAARRTRAGRKPGSESEDSHFSRLGKRGADGYGYVPVLAMIEQVAQVAKELPSDAAQEITLVRLERQCCGCELEVSRAALRQVTQATKLTRARVSSSVARRSAVRLRLSSKPACGVLDSVRTHCAPVNFFAASRQIETRSRRNSTNPFSVWKTISRDFVDDQQRRTPSVKEILASEDVPNAKSGRCATAFRKTSRKSRGARTQSLPSCRQMTLYSFLMQKPKELSSCSEWRATKEIGTTRRARTVFSRTSG